MRIAWGRVVRNTVVLLLLATVLLTYVRLGHYLDNDGRDLPNGPLAVNSFQAWHALLLEQTAENKQRGSDETTSEMLSETELVQLKNGTPEYTFRRNDLFAPSECPTSLQKKLASSSWTSELFHPEIKQLLTSTGISEAEFRRLVVYWMPFGFKYHLNFTYNELRQVLSLFPKLNSIFDFTGSNSRPECLSCAVVGNGGILNGSRMGKEIDSHDMVFRVNHCIRQGYEDDVGSRTTHLVLMDRSLRNTNSKDVPRDKGIKYVFMPCRKMDYNYIRDVANSSSRKLKLRASPSDVRILHPDFIRYIHKVWENTKSFRPTTGGMMFFTALHAGCDSLSVYGMGFTKAYTEHYYDKKFNVYKTVKGSHDFKKEVAIFKRLDQDGVIHWYKRDVAEFCAR